MVPMLSTCWTRDGLDCARRMGWWFSYQQRSPAFAHQFQRPHRPRTIEFVLQFEFVSEPIDARRRRRLDGRPHDEPRRVAAIGRPAYPAEDALAILPRGLEAVVHLAVIMGRHLPPPAVSSEYTRRRIKTEPAR
ncbi:hypothetical protein DID96_36855 [Burkholderia sp. Bp8963]|nr:hypothetical protein DID96_36855 [Burkholderia sp. Bp8963]